jgi:peptide/nickel transport system permease protein
LLFLLLLVAVMAAESGQVSLTRFIFTLGALTVPTYYRLVRAATLQQATREYVMAAKSLGAQRTRILIREILPNVIKPIMAQALIGIGTVIVVEGTLSYLGAGMGGDTISWGRMMQDASGLSNMQNAPHAMFVPAAFIFFTVLALNFVGDKIRERLEVKQSNI